MLIPVPKIHPRREPDQAALGRCRIVERSHPASRESREQQPRARPEMPQVAVAAVGERHRQVAVMGRDRGVEIRAAREVP